MSAAAVPGAREPQRLASLPAPAGVPLTRIPATTRTRRVFGVFNLGAELVVVYASRSQREPAAVIVEVGDSAQRLAGDFSPAQARSLARALVVAADSAEGAQRHPPEDRSPVRAGRAGQQEGGAA